MGDERRQERRGTYASLTALNEVLREGEICFEIHDDGTVKMKVGAQGLRWNDLPYSPDVPDSSAVWGMLDGDIADQADLNTILNDFDDRIGALNIANGVIVGVKDIAWYGSFAAALTAIGNTPTLLYITSDTSVSTAAVVPETLILKSINGARLVKSGSGTVIFQGIGIADPESPYPYFSGFAVGNIVWAGTNYPQRISTKLWSNTGESARILRAVAALNGLRSTIIAFPGVLSSTVTVTSGLELVLSKGEYTNTITGSQNNTFVLQSNTSLLGDGIGHTIIYENADSVRFVAASGMATNPYDGYNENIIVEGITFKGNDLTAVDSSGSAILLGNIKNGIVRNNSFEDTHGFAAYVGGFGTSNHTADGWWIVDNICRGMQTQVMGTVGGRNGHICRNTIVMSSKPGGPSAAIIDLEPNAATFGSENVEICDNILDARLAQQTCNGITIQRVDSGGMRSIRIAGNTIIGFNNAAVSFKATDINVITNEIAVFSHGLQTGQFVTLSADDSSSGGALPGGFAGAHYGGFAIQTGEHTLKMAATYADAFTGTAVDITGQGTGYYLLTANTFLSNGIQVYAGDSCVIENNLIIGGAQHGIDMQNGWGNTIRNNTIMGAAGSGNGILVDSCRESQILDNTIRPTAAGVSQSYDILESDAAAYPVVTISGSPIVTLVSGGNLPWWYRGGIMTIAGTDYNIAEVSNSTLLLDANVPASATVTATLKLSSNLYKGNICDKITLSATGKSQLVSAGDRVQFGTYAPPVIGAHQNDYTANGRMAYRYDLSASSAYNITGFTIAGALHVVVSDGQKHLLVNVGANAITLKHQSSSSLAANRFVCSTGADIVLSQYQAADLEYNGTLSRWMVFKRN